MNWGNHQPRTGLIEAAFAKAMYKREKELPDWCFKSKDYFRSVPLRLVHSKTGQEITMPSVREAASFLNVQEQRLSSGAQSVRGWRIFY